MKKFAVLIAAGVMASVSFGDEFLLEGNHSITVASGTTYTISDKVSGSGRIVLLGGGTLVLNNAENDFTGGVIISNGVLQADASGAFGTGPISLEGDVECRSIVCNARKGVFTNDILLKDRHSSAQYPTVYIKQITTLQGEMRMDSALAEVKSSILTNFYFKIDKNTVDNYSYMLTLEGCCNLVKGSKGSMMLGGGSDDNEHIAYYEVKGKVIADKLFMGDDVNKKGRVYLSNPENEIGQAYIASFNLYCGAENVLYGAEVMMGYDWAWGKDRKQGKMFLQGYNQTFRDITSKSSPDSKKIPVNDNNGTIVSDGNGKKAAIITVIGKTNEDTYSVAYSRLEGNFSIVMDQLQDAKTSYQRFGYFESPMKGDFSVKKGNIELRNGAVFTGVTNITISSGQFYLQNATNALPALAKMTISGGKLRCAHDCVKPISDGLCDVYLSGEGQLQFEKGITNTVRKLFVNGEYMPPGVYTKENFSFMALSHETGALIVRRGRAGGFMILR